MKDYAKIVGQSPVPNRVEVRPTPATGQRHPLPQERVPPPKESSLKTGVWFLVIAVVAVVLFSAYHQHVRRQTLLSNHSAKPVEQNQVQAPQYDFYAVLPSGNSPTATTNSSATSTPQTAATPPAAASAINPPAGSTPATPAASASAASSSSTSAPTSTPAAAPASSPQPAAALAATTQYYLSAGSYANEDDANQMLSQLLLVGVDAHVVTAEDNGSPAYQVLVGPYSSAAAYAPVKQQLAAHQIQVSVVQQ